LSILVLTEIAPRPAWVEWTGSAAAFCTTAAFVPQLVRVIRLKSARDISLRMFLMFSLGVALWLVYGIRLGSWPMIVSNGVTLGLSLSILYFKLKYDRDAVKEMKL
jgi:MtN3 and saliva related transmembrane protein